MNMKNLSFAEIKSAIADKLAGAADAIDLEERLYESKKLFDKTRKQIAGRIKKADIKKKAAALTDKAKRFFTGEKEKKINPFTAIFLIVALAAVLFCLLVAFFYAVFWVLDRKKKSSYYTISK